MLGIERLRAGRFYQVVLPIIGLSLLLMAPGILLHHIIGHSSDLNISWAHGFEQQLANGVLYPRWLPEMNDGAGSPVFYFYGPLPFYVSAPFTALFSDASLGVVLASTVMLGASGLALYLLCRLYAEHAVALLAAALYIMLPYHFAIDIWYRNAFAEQAAFVFMPLMAYCILSLPRDWRFALGLALAFAGQLFSHLPTALLFAPVLVVLTLWVAWQAKSWAVIAFSAGGGFLGIGLAAIYLLPAATLQGMIQAGYWQAIIPAEHLFMADKTWEEFSFYLLPVGQLMAISVFFSVMLLRHWQANRDVVIWALIALVVLFFTTVLAVPFWHHAGIFVYVQLPWRLLCVVDLAMMVLLAILLQRRQFRRDVAVTVLALTILEALVIAAGAQYYYYQLPGEPGLLSMANDRLHTAVRVDATEYLPSCLDLSKAPYHAETYVRIGQNKTIPAQDGMVKVYDYPFLALEREGRAIARHCDPQTGFITFDPAQGQGPVTVQAKTLPIEKTGGMISLASLLVLLEGLLWALKRSTH
jgi:hypothetical protein